eukprot:g31286.t1
MCSHSGASCHTPRYRPYRESDATGLQGLLEAVRAKLDGGHTSEHSLSRWEQSSGYNERLLVAAGAKVHLLNQTGKSAWDIAEQKKQVNCLALFRELPDAWHARGCMFPDVELNGHL